MRREDDVVNVGRGSGGGDDGDVCRERFIACASSSDSCSSLIRSRIRNCSSISWESPAGDGGMAEFLFVAGAVVVGAGVLGV
jgi:hypothetical protein